MQSEKIEIFVNDKLVKISGCVVSGRHIKEAAIEQGVEIEFESVLVREPEHESHDINDEEEIKLNPKERFITHSQIISILVNGKTVRLARHRATGFHIKESAIEQGVPIKLDFLLLKESVDNEHVIEDQEKLHLSINEKFIALPHEIEILVNEVHKVKIVGHRATGREIKQAAISQGVSRKLTSKLKVCSFNTNKVSF
jgi:hypothetical protein